MSDQNSSSQATGPEVIIPQEQPAAVAATPETVVPNAGTDAAVDDAVPPHDAAATDSSQPATGAGALESDQLTLDRQREEERRRTRLLLQQQQQEQSDGLFLLLALIFSAAENGNESLEDNSIADGFARMLGIDTEAFRQTVSDVRGGRLSGQDAASRTYGSVNPSNVDFSRGPTVPLADLIRTNRGPTLLNPDLVARMERDPTVRRYVEMTMDAARRHNLDGNLLANQLWQESRYNPNATSSVGARGIGQFMPFHQGKWGLETAADFRDPAKSIEASARFMRHLTDRVGSQQLALVAYNGGERAVEWVSSRSPGSQITVEDWMAYAGEQRARLGVGSANLWRNQTFDYVTKIDSNYWSRDLIARAERQQGPAQTALASASFGTGVDQTTRPVNPTRDGLTTAYTRDVVTNGGTDQVALAARTDGQQSSPDPTLAGARPA